VPDDFNPFDSAPAVPRGEETVDDIDFDQFLSSLSDQGFTYPGKNGQAVAVDPNAPDPTQTPEPDDDDESEEPVSQEQPPPSDVPVVRLGEKDVPLEEVTLLYELGKTIREQGLEPPPPTVPTEPPPAEEPPPPVEVEKPSWLDQEDEVQMGMWSELQATRAEAKAARAASAQFVADQQQSRIQQEVNEGISMFKTAFPSLTEQEVQTIATLAAPTVSAFVKVSATPPEGVAKAMRLTALDFEPTRDRVLGLTQKSGQQKSTERKSKQSSLTPGGSGSAPRTDVPRSAPRTDRAATEEFARELASSFGTNGRLN
jgi:hypothetical protein